MPCINSRIFEESRRSGIVSQFRLVPQFSGSQENITVRMSGISSSVQEDVGLVDRNGLLKQFVESKGTVIAYIKRVDSAAKTVLSLSGIAAAVSKSDPTIYGFFDDFTDVGKWTVIDGTWTAVSGEMRSNSGWGTIRTAGALELMNGCWSWQCMIEYSQDEARLEFINLGNTGYTYDYGGGNVVGCKLMRYSDSYGWGPAVVDSGISYPGQIDTNWHDFEVTRFNGSFEIFLDGVSKGRGTDNTYASTDHMQTDCLNNNTSRYVHWKKVRARRFAPVLVIRESTGNRSRLIKALGRSG